MKCSSRRNCNNASLMTLLTVLACLNEVQFPKELQPGATLTRERFSGRLNEVQFPKELQRSAQYSPSPSPSEAALRALRA